MDPITAVSVAAAVTQFIDFSVRLLSTSYDIYVSPHGESGRQVERKTIARDLAEISGEVTRSITEAAREDTLTTADRRLGLIEPSVAVAGSPRSCKTRWRP